MISVQSDSLVQARRAIASGGALWLGGLVAQAHVDMTRALRTALRAWSPEGTASGSVAPGAALSEASEHKALAALQSAGYRHLGRLQEALDATADVSTVGTAMAVGATMRTDFEWIWAEAERLLRFTAHYFLSPQARKRARVRAIVVVAVASLALAAVMMRVWGGPRVTASAVLSPDYPASHAADGVPATEWLLPDRTPGWLQITFSSPRRTRNVRIVNAHNKFFLDRGAQHLRVTAFSVAGPITSVEGRFPRITADPPPLDLPLVASDVTHVRVEVLESFGLGGALAEVEVR